MITLNIRDEFIKLGQALKLAGIADSGVSAKFLIEDGKVTVNGEQELRRGRKLHDGDIVETGEDAFTIHTEQ